MAARRPGAHGGPLRFPGGPAPAAPDRASSNASVSSGVASDAVSVIPGSMASAAVNCFSPSSRFLNPSRITTPMWTCVRAAIRCCASPALSHSSSAFFRISRAFSNSRLSIAASASRFICVTLATGSAASAYRRAPAAGTPAKARPSKTASAAPR